jgi:hypothetical protein
MKTTTVTLAGMLVLTAACGGSALSYDVGLEPMDGHPIAVGLPVTLNLTASDSRARTLEVRPSTPDVISAPSTVDLGQETCTYLYQGCSSGPAVGGIDLTVAKAGTATLTFLEQGQVVDVVALEAAEATGLQVRATDDQEHALPMMGSDLTVSKNTWVELIGTLVDAKNRELLTSEPATAQVDANWVSLTTGNVPPSLDLSLAPAPADVNVTLSIGTVSAPVVVHVTP